jgi:glyoxylase-like metal-dependent hydrolase (beta-lactamase superfamily II)/rhodanese-related sulfurtransferase
VRTPPAVIRRSGAATAGAPGAGARKGEHLITFRQLFDPTSSTYTYLLGDPASGAAVLIDPVFEQVLRDSALVRELGLTLVATLDTHVHADHVTGAARLQERLGSRICLAAAAGARGVDVALRHGDRVAFGTRHLEVRATPGHTAGCLTFVLDDASLAFTGDALLVRGCGRTDFQGGSAATLYHSVRDEILTLPPACLLYPGHDYRGLTVTSVAEELRYNSRLGGEANEHDFVEYMNNLALPHPKQMAVAVPANLDCGRTPERAGADPTWAPLRFTFGGIWEIEPATLAERCGAVTVVDVREPEEFDDALGHVPGARLIPLGTLRARSGELGRERPVVVVCRSGARSAQASLILQKEGLAEVANLAGGMLRWRAEGLPVEGVHR